ncbi:heparan-alpha-glucosaminide N-acetyltransferase [Ferrovum sp.]|uniref:heparan-alpha-glucosaminide N-acetyltransferase n=1 Tax=Ferrovum sp. TaxID=2609467 RepID=UPI002639B0E7|nr:heparan-alpha-glucosaminide N-acetyltransferase [Ferrovum sp.]
MPRLTYLDRGRGLAIAMMVLFHGCYDATYFGFAHFDLLESYFWTTWRTLIVTLFVFFSGISLALSAHHPAQRKRRRLFQLGAGALLVSGVTFVLFGARWIYFGVLHFYWLATLISRPLLGLRGKLLPLGLLALVAGQWGVTAMDPRWLNWIGLAAHKPSTEDYAPLLPWIGVLWLGMWTGIQPWSSRPQSNPASCSVPDRGVRWMGRHGLILYLVHQPILFALFELTRRIYPVR